jgi:hypothetical protein
MADSPYVSNETFIAVIKAQFSLINSLTISVATLRAALMQAKALPVPADELERLHQFFYDEEEIQTARELIERLDSDHTSKAIEEFLKNFHGPIQ